MHDIKELVKMSDEQLDKVLQTVQFKTTVKVLKFLIEATEKAMEREKHDEEMQRQGKGYISGIKLTLHIIETNYGDLLKENK